MAGTGKVSFPVSTENEEAQRFFDQGIGQLHGFWYFEAERSFRQVAALDPECAMAYWGMALANWENKSRAKGLIAEAMERLDGVSERERMWIEGLSEYHAEKDRKKRRSKYIRSIEEIIHAYPDDIEAKAFLLVRLWQFKGDLPIPSLVAVDALFSQIFAKDQLHPAHHFRIHLWDYERPETALEAAARCGPSAPGIAHMWHMPGHIYSRLHRYDDAAWQQEASARVDHAHMIRDRVMPDQIHNYAHNNEWLIRNLNHVGRARDALSLAKNMLELPRHPKLNTLKRRGRSASYGRRRLLETLERFELWEETFQLSETIYLEPTDIKEHRRDRLRLLGRAHFGMKQLQELIDLDSALRGELREVRGRRKREREEAEKKLGEEGKPLEAVEKERLKIRKKYDDEIRELKRDRDEVRAYRLLLIDAKDDAKKLVTELTHLRPERQARLLSACGAKAESEAIAKKRVDDSPGRVVPLGVYADLLFRHGKEKEALKVFETLREISAWIDVDTRPFRRLAPLAKKLELPEDWRCEKKLRDDLGERPDFDDLGPFRWKPGVAAEWSLRDGNGRATSLSEFHGTPIVLIFYLGSGCLHCVEQLQTFAPKMDAFLEAGLRVLAISTEDEVTLQKSLAAFQADGKTPPFPLLSDGGLDVFRKYRVYDDFEKQPLHGTFLIDADGLVRWQDISYEPFNDADFVIREAKRLLAQSGGSRTRRARL